VKKKKNVLRAKSFSSKTSKGLVKKKYPLERAFSGLHFLEFLPNDRKRLEFVIFTRSICAPFEKSLNFHVFMVSSLKIPFDSGLIGSEDTCKFLQRIRKRGENQSIIGENQSNIKLDISF